jgi:hypothetical protein
MSAKFTDNSAQIKADMRRKISLALRFIIEDVDKTSNPNTPKRKGDLRNQKLKQVLGMHASIAWVRSYAGIQETKQFRNYTTPGTGPNFARDAVEAVISRAEQHFRKAGL